MKKRKVNISPEEREISGKISIPDAEINESLKNVDKIRLKYGRLSEKHRHALRLHKRLRYRKALLESQ